MNTINVNIGDICKLKDGTFCEIEAKSESHDWYAETHGKYGYGSFNFSNLCGGRVDDIEIHKLASKKEVLFLEQQIIYYKKITKTWVSPLGNNIDCHLNVEISNCEMSGLWLDSLINTKLYKKINGEPEYIIKYQIYKSLCTKEEYFNAINDVDNYAEPND